MKTLLREDTPYSLRIVIAVAAIVLAIIGWLLIINGLHAITAVRATVGVVVLMSAFLALGILRTRRHPFIPLRVSLGIGILWSCLMMWSMATPPHWGSLAFLAVVVLFSVASAAFVSRKPRVGRALLMPVALLGAYGIAVVPVAVWNGGGPLIKDTGAPVAILGAACLAAMWHALSARNDARVTDHTPAL